MAMEWLSPHAHPLPNGGVLVLGYDRDTDVSDPPRAERWDPQTGEWRATAGLNHPRTHFASAVLDDGRVLVAGGLNDIGQSYSSAYLFNPASDSWEKTAGLMVTARTGPSAAVLPDGRVLVVGGYFHTEPGHGLVPGGNLLAAYRPNPDATRPTNPGDGDIVPGPFGAALATAEIFDPSTGQWTSTGSMRFARNAPQITRLVDGRVLVVGSLGGETGVEVDERATHTAEIYDPATGRFTLAGMLPAWDLSEVEAAGITFDWWSVGGGTLAPLDDGGAVLIDQRGYAKHFGAASRSLRFDAAGNAWYGIDEPRVAAEDPMSGARYATARAPRSGAAVARLPDGRILVAGGEADSEFGPGGVSRGAELYVPDSNRWRTMADMPEGRAEAPAVTLPDGSVVVVGGILDRVEGSAVSARSALRLIVGT